jgi:glycosyltransferase involved in cell wall biosynthesis
MKIGFDISQTGNAKAGCGYYAENLIQHLALIDNQNQYFLYPTFGDHFWDDGFQFTCQIQHPKFKLGLHHSNQESAKQFWQNPPTNWEKKLGNIDILHANNFFCPPNPKNIKLVYTLYDLSFLEYPDCTTEHNRVGCFNGIFKASLYADLIIAISEHSRAHFLSNFPHYPEERISVVYPASRFNSETTQAFQSTCLAQFQPQQFWLNVGTIEPRKNIRLLLKAYAKLIAQQEKPYPLVLAGKIGWMEENIVDFIRELGLEQFVHVMGYLDNNELQWLYENCFSFVYPSLFEGFGLPVLEAMALGAAVITSNVSSLPEIVKNAGILINPTKEDEIIQAMLYLMANPEYRKELQSLALLQAKLFSWKHTAIQVLGLYQDIMSEPKYFTSKTLVRAAVS